MKDIIEGLKVVFWLAIITLSFEYSTILGVISLVIIAILIIRGAGKRAYKDNPGLMRLKRETSPTWSIWRLIIPGSDENKTNFENQAKGGVNNNFCVNCDNQIIKESKFCAKCGSRVIK